MRRILTFACLGETLVGTLDEAAGTTGVLIVSGGNELRIGAHRGMALLAARLADAGVPCFRYDRRGIGDSAGANEGFATSGPDMAAAAAAFRANAPGIVRIVALGNCDAATALALHHGCAGIDAVILSNPWIGGANDDGLPPPAAIRARYWGRIKRPSEWVRLFRGGVDIRKLAKGLRSVSTMQSADLVVPHRMAKSLRTSAIPTTILLAKDDNTALAFRAAWRQVNAPDHSIHVLDSASHSFAAPADKDWLFAQILTAVR